MHFIGPELRGQECPRHTWLPRYARPGRVKDPPPHKRSASHIQRSFKVVSAKRAKTSDVIQNRTITFDSDQPRSSK